MSLLTRREWLWLAAGVSSMSAATHKVTVAAHAWVYAAPIPGYDYTPVLEDIFKDLSYAGIEALELMEKPLRHADAVNRIADLSGQYRLPIIGTSYDGGPFWKREQHGALLDDACTVLERLAKLGGRTFGVSVGDAGRRKTPEELDAQAEMVKKLQTAAARHTIVLNLHNHMYEVRDNEHDLNGTLARLPDVKLGPDLDWLTGAHVDPVDFLRRHRQNIVYLHLRNRTAELKWTEALGDGIIDYGPIARTLKRIGFHGDVAIELAHERGFRPTRPLRESWKSSREYVRQVLGY